MAELCQISRCRCYDLVHAGVFPKPVLHPSSKRPMYDREMQEKCLEIRANRDRRERSAGAVQPQAQTQRAASTVESRPRRVQPDHADLLAALKGLGLTTTAQAVNEALTTLFPGGLAGIDQGDVIRKVFLHLQDKKK